MRRLILALPLLAFSSLLTAPAGAEEWDAHSTAEHPCGVGEPPRGHLTRELTRNGSTTEITLTVMQDGDRLCYVEGGNAEAPVIRLRQGDHLTVHLKNDISDPAPLQLFQSKDKLDEANEAAPAKAGFIPVVPGMTHLPTGRTNLHLHGFAVPPVAPADEVMKGCVDPATGPAVCGRREQTYVYDVPADMLPGLYWYHPHYHGETEAQIALGLSGAIVVEGANDDARRAAGIEDRLLLVRQIDEPDEVKPPVGEAEPMHHMAMPRVASQTRGRIDTEHEVQCGSSDDAGLLTLNGAVVEKRLPTDNDLAHFAIPAGAKQLWRVVNMSGDAYLNLVLIDDKQQAVPLQIVARDAAAMVDDKGRILPSVATREAQLVPPASRLEFLIVAPPTGSNYRLVTRAVDTGCAGDPVPERVLALVTAGPAAAASSATAGAMAMPASATMKLGLYDGLLARKTDRQRTIALAEYPRPGTRDETDFYIAEMKPGIVLKPFDMDGKPLITTRAGSVEEWTIENWTHELHAFHMHQVHFRVLSVNGKKLVEPPLLDTVNVPLASPDTDDAKAKITPGRVRIKLYFPPELAGDIPFHCHLLDHEDNGMMAVLRVLPSSQRATPAASQAKMTMPAHVH